MGHTAQHVMNAAAKNVEDAGGIVAFTRQYGLGGILSAIFAQIILGVQAGGILLTGPVRALGNGLIGLIDLFFVGLGEVFGAGTETAVRSFATGLASILGPFAQPAAAGTIMLTLTVFIWSINRIGINPLSFLRDLGR